MRDQSLNVKASLLLLVGAAPLASNSNDTRYADLCKYAAYSDPPLKNWLLFSIDRAQLAACESKPVSRIFPKMLAL